MKGKLMTDEIKTLSMEIGDKRVHIDAISVRIEDIDVNGSYVTFDREQFIRIINIVKAALE